MHFVLMLVLQGLAAILNINEQLLNPKKIKKIRVKSDVIILLSTGRINQYLNHTLHSQQLKRY